MVTLAAAITCAVEYDCPCSFSVTRDLYYAGIRRAAPQLVFFPYQFPILCWCGGVGKDERKIETGQGLEEVVGRHGESEHTRMAVTTSSLLPRGTLRLT
jgi:hypothetical protein